MQAPLGRAVIGGLVMSTVATLLMLPSIFALVIGRKKAVSPSIHPDDPDSAHYDPPTAGAESTSDEEDASEPGSLKPHTDEHSQDGRDGR